MNIYHVHDFKEDEYSWNEVGRKRRNRADTFDGRLQL